MNPPSKYEEASYKAISLEHEIPKKGFLSDFDRDILELKTETDPKIFREKAITWLNTNSVEINWNLQLKPSRRIPEIQEIFSKIEHNSTLEDYAIKNFKSGKHDRTIPDLWITAELTGRLFFNTFQNISSQEVSSKEEADYLVEELSKMPIPWDYPEGCSERAELGCRLLKIMGVPSKKVKKIWIKGTLSFCNTFGNEVLWKWHLAPLIITKSGKKFVIDPSVNRHEALSPENYILCLSGKDPVEQKELESTSTYRASSSPHISQPVTPSRFDHYKKMLYLQHFYVNLGHFSPTIKTLSLTFSEFPDEPLEETPPNKTSTCVIL